MTIRTPKAKLCAALIGALTINACAGPRMPPAAVAASYSCEGLRELSLRPPRASTPMPHTLPPRLFASATTLGAVSDRLERALRQSGYHETGFFCVRRGFALVSRLERIDPHTKRPAPLPQRWKTGSSPLIDPRNGISLRGIIDALTNADPGSYRLLLFYVTDQPVQPTQHAPGESFAPTLIRQASDELTDDLYGAPFTSRHRVRALIYEFRRPAVGKAPEFVTETVPAAQHLAASGILARLG